MRPPDDLVQQVKCRRCGGPAVLRVHAAKFKRNGVSYVVRLTCLDDDAHFVQERFNVTPDLELGREKFIEDFMDAYTCALQRIVAAAE